MLFDGRDLGGEPGTAWSPNGRSIAFAMKPAGATDDNESEVYVMNSDGSGIKRLTAAPGDDLIRTGARMASASSSIPPARRPT